MPVQPFLKSLKIFSKVSITNHHWVFRAVKTDKTMVIDMVIDAFQNRFYQSPSGVLCSIDSAQFNMVIDW